MRSRKLWEAQPREMAESGTFSIELLQAIRERRSSDRGGSMLWLTERCMKNSTSRSGRIETRPNVSAHFNLSRKRAARAKAMAKCRMGSML